MAKRCRLMLQIALLGAIAGCGAPDGETPGSQRDPSHGEATAANGFDESGRPNSPVSDDGDKTADPQKKIIERLQQIEAELNREGHKHSICHEALELVEQALRENPDLAIAYAVRADVHTDHGEAREALKDYRKAFKLDRYNFSYGQKLAVCYEADGQLDEALDVWNDLCRRDPKQWRNFFGRATIYDQMEREEKAQADYERALRLQQQR